MTYTDFFSKIESGTLSGAYLFHGDEEFVKNSALSSAKKIVPEETSDFNITILTEPGEDDIINTSETLPLFADKNSLSVMASLRQRIPIILSNTSLGYRNSPYLS